MNIQNVIKIIKEAVEANLETIILMLIVVGSLSVINIVLGTIIGTVDDGFDVKKFFFGIFKAIVIGVCIFVFCYTLNLFALTLQLTKDIVISADFITTIEVFVILIAWAYDIGKDIISKLKSMKTLKFISYEDIQINPQSQKEIG